MEEDYLDEDEVLWSSMSTIFIHNNYEAYCEFMNSILTYKNKDKSKNKIRKSFNKIPSFDSKGISSINPKDSMKTRVQSATIVSRKDDIPQDISEDKNKKQEYQSFNTKSLVLTSNLMKDFNSFLNQIHLPNLLNLNLSFNKIKDINPIEVTFTRLLNLDVSHNKLSNLDFIQFLPLLRLLRCQHNQITSLKPLQNNNTLQEFWCHDNDIEWTHFIYLQSMNNLQVILKYNNPIEEKLKIDDFLSTILPSLVNIDGECVSQSKAHKTTLNTSDDPEKNISTDVKIMIRQAKAFLQRDVNLTMDANTMSEKVMLRAQLRRSLSISNEMSIKEMDPDEENLILDLKVSNDNTDKFETRKARSSNPDSLELIPPDLNKAKVGHTSTSTPNTHRASLINHEEQIEKKNQKPRSKPSRRKSSDDIVPLKLQENLLQESISIITSKQISTSLDTNLQPTGINSENKKPPIKQPKKTVAPLPAEVNLTSVNANLDEMLTHLKSLPGATANSNNSYSLNYLSTSTNKKKP